MESGPVEMKTKPRATKKRRAKKKTAKKPARARKAEAVAPTIDAADATVKLDATDALRFGKLDAEVRNALLGLQVTDLEIQGLDRAHRDQRAVLLEKKRQLAGEVSRRRAEYTALVTTLSVRYDIPAECMAIDPDTGIVHTVEQSAA